MAVLFSNVPGDSGCTLSFRNGHRAIGPFDYEAVLQNKCMPVLHKNC